MNTEHVDPKIYEVIIARLSIGVVTIGMTTYLPQGIYFYVVFGILSLIALQRSTWLETKYLVCERNILTKDMRMMKVFCSDTEMSVEICQQELRFRIIFQESARRKGLDIASGEIYTHAILAAQEVCREEKEQRKHDQVLLARLGCELTAIDEKMAMLKK